MGQHTPIRGAFPTALDFEESMMLPPIPFRSPPARGRTPDLGGQFFTFPSQGYQPGLVPPPLVRHQPVPLPPSASSEPTPINSKSQRLDQGGHMPHTLINAWILRYTSYPQLDTRLNQFQRLDRKTGLVVGICERPVQLEGYEARDLLGAPQLVPQHLILFFTARLRKNFFTLRVYTLTKMSDTAQSIAELLDELEPRGFPCPDPVQLEVHHLAKLGRGRVQDFVRIFENGGYGANGAATWTNQDAYTETYK
ncbi:hypothetical protein FA13DRAFT_1713744 [Coprinellus micaceus]|uniref:Uncharacterized protein n=1 Tax=Coprinellus micaceus TaxID=71717 RepID=A0A4Y7SV45_COPMI|nr:hypothetical protein FA13DRAFT_1713744 [Coprinellus micaceus]